MKRKTKNIIMIIVLLLTLGGIFFTMWYAKDNATTSNKSSMSSDGQMQGPPDMQSNSNNSSNDNNSNPNNSGNTPPSMPGGDSNGTPPEKPSGDTNATPPDMNSNSSNSSSNTPPTKPDENSTDLGGDQTNNSSQSSDNSSNQGPSSEMPSGALDMENSNSGLGVGYYIILGILGLLAGLNILYLIMSRFNKKSFKETFKEKDKIVIYVLGTIILTSALTVANGYGTNKLISANNGKTNNQSTSSSVTYSGATEVTKDITSGNYTSKNANENALLVAKGATVSNVTVTKTGDSDGGDSTSFYGTNSAILAKDGAKLTLKNATITTKANGANGVFSFGGSATTNNSSSDGTTVTVSNSKITTTGNNAGGIMTTGGGITKAINLEINTSGTSSAAIRSDRGGGTVTVNKGTYTTTGQGSPAIYSTAEISVSDATLVAKASEGVVIEGANSVSLDNCKLTDTNNKLNGQSTTYKNIFLYQSMSGDADNGNATFTAKDSTITTNKGDTLYVTNNTATINLEKNKIVNNDSEGNFLRAQKDSWGSSGSNGGKVTLNMINQSVKGNIVIDSISTLDMTMKTNSYYEGTINGDKNAKGIKLTLDKSSKITLTGNSYVTSLDDEDTSYSNIDFNGYKLYVDGKSIN